MVCVCRGGAGSARHGALDSFAGPRRPLTLSATLLPPGRCDEQILPAVYAWVGASFDATPTQLGAITLGRAMMQALSSPLGGVAGQRWGV